jgi:hypothetical protein
MLNVHNGLDRYEHSFLCTLVFRAGLSCSFFAESRKNFFDKNSMKFHNFVYISNFYKIKNQSRSRKQYVFSLFGGVYHFLVKSIVFLGMCDRIKSSNITAQQNRLLMKGICCLHP